LFFQAVATGVRRRLYFKDVPDRKRAGTTSAASKVAAPDSLRHYANGTPRVPSHEVIRRAGIANGQLGCCGFREACCGSWLSARNAPAFDGIDVTRSRIGGTPEKVMVTTRWTDVLWSRSCDGSERGTATEHSAWKTAEPLTAQVATCRFGLSQHNGASGTRSLKCVTVLA